MKVNYQKYFIFLALSVFTFLACGRKVENSDPNGDRNITNQLPLTATDVGLKISFDEDGSNDIDVYEFPADAWLSIPEHVFVESGDPLNFTVRVYFNTIEAESLIGAQELYCEYENAKQIGSVGEPMFDGYYHHFVGCFEDVDGDGIPEEINYAPGTQVAQDAGNFVRMEYVSGFTESEAQVTADVEIDWF